MDRKKEDNPSWQEKVKHLNSKQEGSNSIHCDRCGRCCIEFAHQIHFLPEESLIRQKLPPTNSLIEKIIAIYHQVKDQYSRVEKGTLRYFIPTKQEIIERFPQESLPTPILHFTQPHECMFLTWNEQRLPHCLIHAFNPRMCQDYPTSKGNLCRGHPERKYSLHFFQYQQQKIGFAIQVLRQLYQQHAFPLVAYDILTLMMDFGQFQRSKLEKFFVENHPISLKEVNLALDQLIAANLVFPKSNSLEGISLKEVEKLIDTIAHEKGWSLENC